MNESGFVHTLPSGRLNRADVQATAKEVVKKFDL
jgi:hypothetical protein